MENSTENEQSPVDKVQKNTMTDQQRQGQGQDRRSITGGLAALDAGNAQFFFKNAPQPSEKTRLVVQLCFMFLIALVNVACIIIGYISIDKCPASPEIPYYLLIKGAVGLLDIPSYLLQYLVFKNPNPTVCAACCVHMIRSTLCSLNFGLLIYGSIKVYSIYEPEYLGKDYCDELCYKLSFTVITFMWCALGLALLCCCCALPFYCMFVQATYGHTRNASVDEGNANRRR